MDIILPFNLTNFNGFGVFNFIFEYLGVHKQPTSPDFRCSNLLIDKKDTNREINPLKIAKDAIVIDNSDLSEEEQNNLIFGIIKKKIESYN